jgi:hypothetical protein
MKKIKKIGLKRKKRFYKWKNFIFKIIVSVYLIKALIVLTTVRAKYFANNLMTMRKVCS